MSSGGQQPSAPQTPFSPNYRERRSAQSRGPGNAYTQRPGQQPNPQQPAQQLPPPPQQGNMQYDGGGYSTPFGGYGGFFEQYRTPFSGYGGGFSQPFALPQNPYNPYGSQQFNRQPPPGMEVNPNYQPSNRLSQDVRPSDMEFRPIQGANPATGVMPSEPISDPNERTFSTQALIRSTKDGVSGYYTDGSMSRFVPDEPQAQQGSFGNNFGSADDQRSREIMNRSMTNPSSITAEDRKFLEQQDLRNQNSNMMQNQQIERQRALSGFGAPYGGFSNPYGGYGAPYGGSPYMGMFGGLGSLFGGNGFQGMNQQARAQQMALENQRQFPQGSFSQNTVYPDGRVVY
jgi:hypothetical protein